MSSLCSAVATRWAIPPKAAKAPEGDARKNLASNVYRETLAAVCMEFFRFSRLISIAGFAYCLGNSHAQKPQNIPDGILLPSRSTFGNIFGQQVVQLRFSFTPGAYYYPQFFDNSSATWTNCLDFPLINNGQYTDFDEVPERFYRLAVSGGVSSPLSLQYHGGSLIGKALSLSCPPYPGWDYLLQQKQPRTETWETLRGSVTNAHFTIGQVSDPGNYRVVSKPPIVREQYTSILIAGQSNALLSDNAYYPQRVEGVFNITPFFEFRKPSVFFPQLKGAFVYSFAIGTATELSQITTNNYILIGTAIGGTTIRQWLPTSNRFDRATLYGDANYRRVIGAPKGIQAIWYYGHESSSGQPHIRTYIEDWRHLMAEFRQDNGSVPVIYAQLAKSTNPVVHANEILAAEKQRQTEGGQAQGVDNTHMIVTFDLPLADDIHLSAEGQRLLGHRFALAMRQHVYHENINGTGPRLVSVGNVGDDASLIAVQFDKPINEVTNNYDNQFKITSGGVELQTQTISRSSDSKIVFLQLGSHPTSNVQVSYGSPPAQSDDLFLTNVIRDVDGLPAPAFGPLVITNQ
jgi:hypothetical protein